MYYAVCNFEPLFVNRALGQEEEEEEDDIDMDAVEEEGAEPETAEEPVFMSKKDSKDDTVSTTPWMHGRYWVNCGYKESTA